MVANSPVIVWFRRDLRLPDNPAWSFALETGSPVVPVYIHSADKGDWAIGGAAKWWLHHALVDLSAALEQKGTRLILRCGESQAELASLIAATGARAVVWNRRYEPESIATDKALRSWLEVERIEVGCFNSHLLFEPWTVENQSGNPFQVFTPFWKSLLPRAIDLPVGFRPGTVEGPGPGLASRSLDDLGLLPKTGWDAELNSHWKPTRRAGLHRLNTFIDRSLVAYSTARDAPAVDGTSSLSPWLAFGQIGVREIHAKVEGCGALKNKGGQVFWSEVGWREFAYHLLYHFPHTPDEPLRDQFRSFPWHKERSILHAWQRAETGYPLVDAGMRQLWSHGWIHNRVRMVVASFLVKHLLQPWQEGARWFWDTLVDADLASNTLGWQWTAGCGADAAPFFRVFNPFTQGEKFDPGGGYARRWLPELAKLPDKFIYRPWEASAAVLNDAGVRLGVDYPRPVVDHNEGRQRALRAYAISKDKAP